MIFRGGGAEFALSVFLRIGDNTVAQARGVTQAPLNLRRLPEAPAVPPWQSEVLSVVMGRSWGDR